MQKEFVLKQYETAIKTMELRVPISPKELYNIMIQLTHFASLSLVPRSYNTRYLLTADPRTYESVASHTLLAREMITKALNFFYEPNFKRTKDGFTYYEISEAICRHDLPENETGDKPDNGDRDNESLALKETEYWDRHSSYSPSRESGTEEHISFLLQDQNSQPTTVTGGQIHATDKASAIFMNLCLEEKGMPPIMYVDSSIASEQERNQMSRCERHLELDGFQFCYASEMWTIGYFDKGIDKMDREYFFTALVIMKTIAVAGKWYDQYGKKHI